MEPTKLTREELYEQVWTTPMSHLAGHYGLSDVGLAKICRSLNIPRPTRGYWQQLAAGDDVKRVPLPKPEPAQDVWIHLQRVDNPVPKRQPVPAPDVPVPKTLQGAHDAIVRLGALLQRAKPDPFDRLVIPGPGYELLAVTVATHRRALLILEGLCRALVGRGHTVAVRREKKESGVVATLTLKVFGIQLEASLVERLDKRERKRTPEEQSRVDMWAKPGDKPPPLPREEFASGRLQLTIRGLSAWRSSWSDAKSPLERILGRVVVTLEAEGETRRLQREAAERQRAEAEARRLEQEVAAERLRLEREAEKRRQAELEARRQHQLVLSRDLRSLTRRWTVANQVRAFLEAVEEVVPVPDRGERFSAWLQWAYEHADQLDPLTQPHRIAWELEPDLTRLDTPEGEP